MFEKDILMVTFDGVLVALMLSFGLFILSKVSVKDIGEKGKKFRSILLFNICLALSELACYSARHHVFGVLDRTIGQTTGTLVEIFLMIIIWQWLIYVDYCLYHSMDHIRFRYKYLAIPIYVTTGIFVLNFFTGIVFYYDENVVSHLTPLYYVLTAVKYLYVVGTFVLLAIHKKRNGTLHFVDVWAFAAPTLVASVLTMILPYSLMGIGIAIACVMVYFSELNERCYQDSETGFYNRPYLDHLINQYKEGAFTFSSGIVMCLDNDDEKDFATLADILKKELPEECETVRLDKERFLSLTKASKKSSLKRLADEIYDATDEWNEDNNGNLEVIVSWLLKKPDEEPHEFVERLIAET